MNNPFLNRLANILDGLPPYQLSHEASYYDAFYRYVKTDDEPVLHRLDSFFMTGDIRDSDFEPSWIPWEGNRLRQSRSLGRPDRSPRTRHPPAAFARSRCKDRRLKPWTSLNHLPKPS